MEGSPLPDWMKPNIAKVIVLPSKIENGQSVLLATPLGDKIPPLSLDWLIQFVDQHKLPLIYTEQIMEKEIYTKRQNYRYHGPVELKITVTDWFENANSPVKATTGERNSE